MLSPESKGAPRGGDVWVDGWEGRRRSEAAHWEEHEDGGVGGAGEVGRGETEGRRAELGSEGERLWLGWQIGRASCRERVS